MELYKEWHQTMTLRRHSQLALPVQDKAEDLRVKKKYSLPIKLEPLVCSLNIGFNKLQKYDDVLQTPLDLSIRTKNSLLKTSNDLWCTSAIVTHQRKHCINSRTAPSLHLYEHLPMNLSCKPHGAGKFGVQPPPPSHSERFLDNWNIQEPVRKDLISQYLPKEALDMSARCSVPVSEKSNSLQATAAPHDSSSNPVKLDINRNYKLEPLSDSPSETVRIFQCKTCGYDFTDPASYKQHIAQHTPPAKLYNCYMCCRSYKQARDYRAHVATHRNGTIFKCDICPATMSKAADYLQHLKGHRQKDLHSCPHCRRYFRDSCTLATHMRTHTGEKPYKCEICGKKFRQSGTYRRHKKVHG